MGAILSALTPKSSALLAMLSLTTYVASFFLPVFADSNPPRGYAAFFMALFYPLLFAIAAFPAGLVWMLLVFPSWLANVAYWVALYRFSNGEPQKSRFWGVVAVLFGLSIIVTFNMGRVSYGIGYWSWVGSMAMMAVAGMAAALDQSNRKTNRKPPIYWYE